MATAWQIPLREITKHLNAFASGSASTVATDYTTSPLTTTQVVDPYFSLDFITDKAIDCHGRLALEIANVREHPWRVYIGPSVTGNLTDGATLPTTATNGKAIVGAWGQVSAGGIFLTEAAPERVRDYKLHTTTIYSTPYLYYIDGTTITLTNSGSAIINVCTYERADVVTAVAANGNITIPDTLVDALVAGTVGECIVEAKGIEQASYYLNLFQAAINSIRANQTTMPMMELKRGAV